MKNFASTLLILGACLAPNAWAADKDIHSETTLDSKADGTYKGSSTYEATDASGAKVTSKIQEEESTTLLGKHKTHAKAETSRDPKGLGNKSWAKGETTATSDAHGNLKRETTAKSVDSAGTLRKSDENTKTVVKGNGASETTYSKEMETDPKGLMNKSTAKVEETTKRAADGSSTRVVKKEVDGKVVEESVH